MAPKLNNIIKDAKEQERLLEPLVSAINECSEFLAKFTKKGFLMHVICATRDTHYLNTLDKKLTDSIQNLSVRISGVQMDLQVQDSAKLNQILDLIQNKVGDNRDPKSLSPDVIAEIAKQAGCASKEALSSELENFGFKLDEINNTVNKALNLMEKVDTKMDKVLDKVEDITELLEKQRADQANDRDDMKEILREIQAETTHALEVSLAAMRSNGTASSVVEKFSTKLQTERLAKKAEEMFARGLDVILIHEYGIGELVSR